MKERFRRAALFVAEKSGTPSTFFGAALLVAIWAASGPYFHYSDTWQLWINTGTTILTFLLAILVQATQNRDAAAIHLKLDELIRSSAARNLFVDLQDATEAEINLLRQNFKAIREKGD